MQIEILHHGRCAMVSKADCVKLHRTEWHGDGRCVRGVHHRIAARERIDTVLHRAHMLEQGSKFPHDPVRDAIQAHGHGGRRCHRTDAHITALPEPERHAGGAANQHRAEELVDELDAADQPHLRPRTDHEVLHGAPCIQRFPVCMRKQFDGSYVGIRVGNAPGHERTGIGLAARDLAQARHEVPQRHQVKQQPAQKWHQQVSGKAPRHRNDGTEVDDDKDQYVCHDEPAIAHRQCSLHDLGGNPPGKFILVEAHALPQHQTVEIPAQAHGKGHCQHLMLEQGLQARCQRARGKNDHQPDQFGRPGFQQLRGRQLAQPVHQLRHQPEKPGLRRTNKRGAQGHRQHERPHVPTGMPQEGEKAYWRRLHRMRLEGIHPRLKP